MAFNANTFKANREAKEAYEKLAQAKDIKARAAVGDAYDWEVSRIPMLVELARFSMKTALHYRAMNQINRT
jgi:hypothetical protein